MVRENSFAAPRGPLETPGRRSYFPAPFSGAGGLGRMAVMGRRVAGVLALLAGALAACVAGQPERSLSRLGPAGLGGPAGADVVQIDVALVERPPGDRYVNGELWQLADEQGVTLERKAVLEENGFRVGQVGGLPPAGLQALL